MMAEPAATRTTTTAKTITIDNPFHYIPNLPPPSAYINEVPCQEEWKKVCEERGKTVFGLAWSPSCGSKQYLVGCTSAGTVLVWRVPEEDDSKDDNNKNDDVQDLDVNRFKMQQDNHDNNDDADDEMMTMEQEEEDPGSIRQYRNPILKFKISSTAAGKLYNVKFLNMETDKPLLGVCGDEGVLLYLWSDILALLETPTTTTTKQVVDPKPVQIYHTHKSQNIIEINDFDNDAQNNRHLFGASGDTFGCYKWDMETGTILSTYESAKRGYLHTVKTVDSSTSVGSHSLLLLGGEDGILGVWDHSQDKLIQNIDMKNVMNDNASFMTSSSSSDHEEGAFTPFSHAARLWTSHIETAAATATVSSSSNWWHVCGGTVDYSLGYIACFHAPTRSLVTGCTMNETPHRMALYDSTLTTIANEKVVSHWSPTSLKRSARFWCSPPCSYALSVRDHDGLTAIGGVGTTIDVFEHARSKLYSLRV